MSWPEFLVVLAVLAIAMLACRVLPLFILKGRKLPDSLERALALIPPAAFAALVANDLYEPDMFSSGIWPAAIPLIAAVFVVAIALKTRSLLWSAVAGVAAFAALLLL